MAADFRMIIRDLTGAKVADVSNHLGLAYTRRVNARGQFQVQLDGAHPAVALLADKCQIEIKRRAVIEDPYGGPPTLIPWYTDFYGLYRDRESQFTEDDQFTARGVGVLGILDWRRIAYKAGVANRALFSAVPCETILKTLVTRNATSAGTTGDGRHKNATSSGAVNGYTISVQADGAGGNTHTIGCANANLLETLQKVARVAGGDFDLVKTGALTYEFRWYAGQLGTDRTASLTFALERGNMTRPAYRHDRRDERTSIIVGGQGQGSDREYVVRTGPDYDAATNDIEDFVDATETNTTAYYNTQGDKRADALRALQTFDFEVVQTPASAYGLHYFVGDLALAAYRDVSATVKVMGVTVSSDAGQVETVEPELEHVA